MPGTRLDQLSGGIIAQSDFFEQMNFGSLITPDFGAFRYGHQELHLHHKIRNLDLRKLGDTAIAWPENITFEFILSFQLVLAPLFVFLPAEVCFKRRLALAGEVSDPIDSL